MFKRFILAGVMLALTATAADAQVLPFRRQLVNALNNQQRPQQPQTDPALLAALQGQSQQLSQILGAMQSQQAAAVPQAQVGPMINYHYHTWQGGPYAGSVPGGQVTPQQQQVTPAPIVIGQQQPQQPIIVLPQQQPQQIAYPGGQPGGGVCPCPQGQQRGQQGYDPRPIINIPAPQPAQPIINIPAPSPNSPIINIPAPSPSAPQINIPAPAPNSPAVPIQGPQPNAPAIPIPQPGAPRIQPGALNPNQPGIIISGPPQAYQRYTNEPPPTITEDRIPGTSGGPVPHESYRWATPTVAPASR